MPICPICNNETIKFKDNSHVVPRWALALTKTNGKNLLLKSETIKTNQSDKMAEAWCGDCEDSFARLDGYGASFFRDKNYFKGNLLMSNGQQSIYVEQHRKDDSETIAKFVSSVFVREFLYKKSKNEPTDKEFEDILSHYVSGGSFIIFCLKFSKLPLSVQEPQVTGDYRMMLNGYLIYLFTSAEQVPEEYKFSLLLKDFLIPIHEDTSDQYTKTILAHKRPIQK